MAKPSLGEVRALAAAIRAKQPGIGQKKLATEIKSAQPQWKLGNQELRKALADPSLKAVRTEQPPAAEPAKKRA